MRTSAGISSELGRVYAQLVRFNDYVGQWYPSVARAIKMGMRLLKLPGGEGGLREPYRMPPEEEYQAFASGLLSSGIPEIEEQARAPGIRLPG